LPQQALSNSVVHSSTKNDKDICVTCEYPPQPQTEKQICLENLRKSLVKEQHLIWTMVKY